MENQTIHLDIEMIYLPYDPLWLKRWKERDPAIVPEEELSWKGPGVANGYGFGEWLAEQYYQEQGFEVIKNQFNLISKNSKFTSNNTCIRSLIGPQKVDCFGDEARKLYSEGYQIENLDLFVYNQQECYFIEVKKGKDQFRVPQARFMYMAQKLLQVDSKIVRLDPDITSVKKGRYNYDFVMPSHPTSLSSAIYNG